MHYTFWNFENIVTKPLRARKTNLRGLFQVLILPPYQKKGIGYRLLNGIYQHYLKDEKVLDITGRLLCILFLSRAADPTDFRNLLSKNRGFRGSRILVTFWAWANYMANLMQISTLMNTTMTAIFSIRVFLAEFFERERAKSKIGQFLNLIMV